MHPPKTDPKERHTGIWRFPPLRLLRWIDNQGSPALTKLVVGLILVMICWVASLCWQQIVAWIPFLGRVLSALRTQVLIEMWAAVAFILVPLASLWLSQFLRLVIHSADWHTDAQHRTDVTEYFKKESAKGIRRIPATIATLGDPHEHSIKTLTVDYSVWGRRRTKSVKENETIILD